MSNKTELIKEITQIFNKLKNKSNFPRLYSYRFTDYVYKKTKEASVSRKRTNPNHRNKRLVYTHVKKANVLMYYDNTKLGVSVKAGSFKPIENLRIYELEYLLKKLNNPNDKEKYLNN